jgi:uncharacterized repeat protein (TIGR03803 family)
MKKSVFTIALCLAALVGSTASGAAQTVQKVKDLIVGTVLGQGYGASTPQTTLTLIGTNLWFTSNNGGAAGAGGVFYLDLSNSNVVQVATLDNNTGKSPWSSAIVVADGFGWFTTSAGGTGAKGTLSKIDFANNNVTAAYNFPTNDYITSFNGQGPHSTPVRIGDELWFTCSAGGTNSTFGTVTKYNLTNGAVTDVIRLSGTNTDYPGRQPLGNSLVQVSNAFYFLTFAGGAVGPAAPNGAGVLGKITFDNAGNPLYSAKSLPGGHIGFPSSDVVYDGSNYLYFTTVGSATNPGAIARYDLTAQTFVSLFNFVTNLVTRTNYGAQPYCTPVLYDNTLYFTTLSGGSQAKGILGALNLSNNVVTKLADFEGVPFGASPQYHGGTIYTNPVTGSVAIYFPINKGGSGNTGAIIRIALPPPPIVASVNKTGNGTQISWTGGYAPFGVDEISDLTSSSWTTNVFSGLYTNSIIIPTTGSQSFFRVTGASE